MTIVLVYKSKAVRKVTKNSKLRRSDPGGLFLVTLNLKD